MRILITGTRDARLQTDAYLRWRVLDMLDAHVPGSYDTVTIVHGSCQSGVDFVANDWAEARGCAVEHHPADWSLGRKAGPLRNQEMVDSGIDLVLAFPKGKSPGTRGTIRMAEKAGLKVIVTEL